ncbi:hypothetical protein BH23GEM11_BH23GEM11_18700 [soil metagenome]
MSMVHQESGGPRPARTAVYVVTGGDSSYLRMALVSATSLNLHNPSMPILFLTDGDPGTAALITRHLGPKVRILCPDGLPPGDDPVLSSRHIKTQMAKWVEAPFLFLDSDTLCVSALPDRPALKDVWGLKNRDVKIGAVLDRNRGEPFHNDSAGWTKPLFEQMGWAHPTRIHVNSGVIFFNCRDEAARLCEHWHRAWSEQVARTGQLRDQPGLNHSIHALELPVTVLGVRYNAMVAAAPYFARGASILHFFTRDGMPAKGTLLHRFMLDLKRTGQIDREAMSEQISASRRRYTEKDYGQAPDVEPEYVVYSWVTRALRRGDHEAAFLHAKELVRMRHPGLRTVLAALGLPLLALLAWRIRRRDPV